jgi:hypothetical protein
MLSVRMGRKVVVAAIALAGMTPALALAAQPRAKNAAKRCEWAAAHKAHLGAPLITDARGPYVGVLFVDRRDNYARFCVYGPNSGVQGSGQITSPDQPAPGPSGIEHDIAGGSCDPASGRAVWAMHGQVGRNVASATFSFANRAPAHAAIKDGFYLAWWPWMGWPDRITLRTKSGTLIQIPMHTGKARSC